MPRGGRQLGPKRPRWESASFPKKGGQIGRGGGVRLLLPRPADKGGSFPLGGSPPLPSILYIHEDLCSL